MAYIMAHAFFLDLTLCFIDQNTGSITTLGYYIYQAKIAGWTDFNYLLLLSFILTFMLFHIANYYKQKI